MRNSRGFDMGVVYGLGSGVVLIAGYAWGQNSQSGFDFLTNEHGSNNNKVWAQVPTAGMSVCFRSTGNNSDQCLGGGVPTVLFLTTHLHRTDYRKSESPVQGLSSRSLQTRPSAHYGDRYVKTCRGSALPRDEGWHGFQ
jgi:hypothetical protein